MAETRTPIGERQLTGGGLRSMFEVERRLGIRQLCGLWAAAVGQIPINTVKQWRQSIYKSSK